LARVAKKADFSKKKADFLHFFYPINSLSI